MHHKDKIVLLTLLSYGLMLIGFGFLLFLLLRNLCGLSLTEARNYAIFGTIFIILIAYLYVKREQDKWMLQTEAMLY